MTTSHSALVPSMPVRKLQLRHDPTEAGWLGSNALLTAYFAGLSATFPAAEGLFIRTVQRAAKGVEDPPLQARIKAFIGQEAQHSKQHIYLNRWLTDLGLPAVEQAERMSQRVAEKEARFSPEEALAAVTAGEHYTATLARIFLTQGELLRDLPDAFRTLMIYHAIEEIEHKSVSFDLYQKTVGDVGLRRRAILEVTAGFSITTLRFLLGHARVLGAGLSLREWRRVAAAFFGPRGIVPVVAREVVDFMRADFHPDQTDDSALIADWARLYPDVAAHTQAVA